MNTITAERLEEYDKYLATEEKSPATREKYLRDLRRFAEWLAERKLTKTETGEYKQHLEEDGRSPSGINASLAALNGFLKYLGREDCRVRFLHIQRRMYRQSRKDLTRGDYEKLLEAAAAKGDKKLTLVLEAICSTGIRVSELKYFTVEAIKNGETEIQLKGKIRTILFPGKLAKKLLKYAKEQGIASGEVFLSGGGQSLDRRRIWEKMKALCKSAGVEPKKVFPHNLRHLFARTFYGLYKDIAKLADMLGHSSIETTRIYLKESFSQHRKQLDRMNLMVET